MTSSNDSDLTIDRILRERLEQYEVPQEVREQIRKELLSLFGRPERKPFGACVMTPEASMAADKERVAKRNDAENAKPRIV